MSNKAKSVTPKPPRPSVELLKQLSQEVNCIAGRICTAEEACKAASDPTLSGGRSQAIAELTAVWLRKEIESLDEIVEQIDGLVATAEGGAA